jgi:hypothetical protein
MKVGILTITEKESLDGQSVQIDWDFNPIQDCNNDWIISTQEIEGSIYPQNEWVKTLPLIDWCAPPSPLSSGYTGTYTGNTL